MNTTGRLSLRLALVVTFAAMLGLTACGRKGGLDLPPSSTASTPVAGSPTAGADAGESGGSQEPGGGTLRGPNKRIPLDVLLN